MKQLTQKLKDGRMQITEVSVPNLRPGMILVRNYYSLISAGTESSTVKAARKGYIGKAMERPQQIKQVFNTMKTQGPVKTYQAVMKKLNAYSSLGYSCAGEVIDVASDISEFVVGDIVACGGSTASHAEVIAVPVNLCTKVEQSAKSIEHSEDYLKMVAYNTLGAIAMQGVRQVDLRLGETCAIIGMGLLGQLTAILLKASGVRVAGIDLDPVMIELGCKHCLDLALLRDDPGIKSKILEFSGGIGCDGVIITAASNSLDPINFSGEISRKKGTVVVVGAVPTGFNREHFYKKELTVKMSCSYGPGRYDPEYEDKGCDYPVGYVRWTEKRNMQAFQELIASGKIDIGYLTTHIFKLDDAPNAYDMILERSEAFVGILIEYDRKKRIANERVISSKLKVQSLKSTPVSIGFIGAGSYAQGLLIPNIPKSQKVVLKGVMTSTSTSSRSVADRYGFEYCTGKEDDILRNDEINTVFIATRHDSHGYYVKKAIEAGKHVFVEKPLCLTIKELEGIKLATETHRQPQTSHTENNLNGIFTQPPVDSTIQPTLMVGYNRRFSPLTQVIKEKITIGPMSMIYRLNAGAITADSWVQDVEVGGGRILGEVCHFVDCLTFINGSLPVSVYATAMKDVQSFNDTVTISLKYENGSIGSIQYFANGSKSLPKEYVEIYSHGVTAIINDFRELKIYGKGRPYRKKLMSQDKGQKNEVRRFVDLILHGGPPLIPLEELFSSTEVTFKIIESLRTVKVIHL